MLGLEFAMEKETIWVSIFFVHFATQWWFTELRFLLNLLGGGLPSFNFFSFFFVVVIVECALFHDL